jgi:lipoate-protein ligase B
LRGRTLYADAWGWQRALVAARQRGEIPDGLILLEHEPVFTFGRSSRADHLLVTHEFLRANGFGVYDIERGGSVTYHGPGQLVGYPILDLRAYDEDVVKYMRALEETILRTLADLGISAKRARGFPGVWVGEQKIAAVGVAVKRKVTMHGFALNVDPQLTHFSYINPCGLGRPVTSVAQVLGHPESVDEVRSRYVGRFSEVFGLTVEALSREDLEPWVSQVPAPPAHYSTVSNRALSRAASPV